MSLKQDFIAYVEKCSQIEPMPENLIEYWNKYKGTAAAGENKEAFTEMVRKFLCFYRKILR